MRSRSTFFSLPSSLTPFLLSALILFLTLPFIVSAVPPPPHINHPPTDASIHGSELNTSASTGNSHTHVIADATFSPPDPHSHGSHRAPKVSLDDTGIHHWHQFPPTYLAADFRLDNDTAIFGEEFDETWDPENASGHKGLMLIHVLGMTLAYFGALPIVLALRAADHPSHYIANAAFLVVALVGWLAGVAYKSTTPERYEGAVHNSFGNFLVLLSVCLAALDSSGPISRAITFYRRPDDSLSAFTRDVLHSSTDDKWLTAGNRDEMVGFVEHDDNNNDNDNVVYSIGDEEDDGCDSPRELSGNRSRPPLLSRQITSPSCTSTGSDGTLQDIPTSSEHKLGSQSSAYDVHHEGEAVWCDAKADSKIGTKWILHIALAWLRRTQVVIAYVVTLTGITIYTGMCRAGFINTCAAHLIKGSIFFLYGSFTFARYLGAYADLGWAWNCHPGTNRGPTAEMIECAIIFTYGITNTWMERFGAHRGDPYTVKQVQHISIAVMFWFAGLMGMFLESHKIRSLLATGLRRRGRNEEPPTYSFSFNPLPALVIAVTGIAMAAHHQDYVFQIAIHSLWGILLAGGSASRLLTYFFLWFRPSVESTLPSRPPTEVLTSFGWAAGGIVLMLSDEEVAFAAMRAGYDDMMAFLNVTVALTSLVFCWQLVVMAVKGFAVSRLQGQDRVERVEGNEGARV